MVPGETFNSDSRRLYEYLDLMNTDTAPHIRAWVREADKTIRANNAVYGIRPDAEEDLPWLVRAWRSFTRLFIVR